MHITTMSKIFSAMLLVGATQMLSAATLQEINSMDEYNKVRAQPGSLVILYNSATCGACKPMEEVLKKVAQSSHKIRFYKIELTKKDPKTNKDVFEGLGKKVGIAAFPTTEFIKPGEKPRLERGSMGFDEVDELIYEIENGKKKPVKTMKRTKAGEA